MSRKKYQKSTERKYIIKLLKEENFLNQKMNEPLLTLEEIINKYSNNNYLSYILNNGVVHPILDKELDMNILSLFEKRNILVSAVINKNNSVLIPINHLK